MTRLRVVPLPDGKYLVVFDRVATEDAQMLSQSFSPGPMARIGTPEGCAGIFVFADEVEVP